MADSGAESPRWSPKHHRQMLSSPEQPITASLLAHPSVAPASPLSVSGNHSGVQLIPSRNDHGRITGFVNPLHLADSEFGPPPAGSSNPAGEIRRWAPPAAAAVGGAHTNGSNDAFAPTQSFDRISDESFLSASSAAAGSDRVKPAAAKLPHDHHLPAQPGHTPADRGIGRKHSFPNADHGVALTWKDLWITVSTGKDGTRPLLQNLTGYAEPGQVLAIMGPSGSGKSTLLDTLAGRLPSNVKQQGEILVNGRRQSLSYGNSAYVTQDDVLMATLTVRETVFYSAQLQLPSSMSVQEKKEWADQTIRDMGLQGAVNTRIGGWRARGLSGGEKRRVSIAIEILTRPRLLFLDEPTSGLDSAAAFHVVNRLKHLAEDRRTVIASIHQPSSDVFELFTSLCLLSSGRPVYFGAVAEAREFFSANGFPCPFLRNPSDHYLRTINKDFERDIEEGAVKLKTDQVIDILVKAYSHSTVANSVVSRVNDISKLEGPPLEIFSDHANFFTQVYVLTQRSFKNMYRDLGYYWLRLAIYIALCLCVGTLYYKVGTEFSSIQARAAMLMFVAAFLTFMAIGGFPSFVEDMKVFDRDRLNGHYGVASFVVANTLSSSPYLLLISALPGAIAYFLVDLHHGFDHFIYFVLTLYACMIVVESLMMMVASIVPDFLLGIITGAGIQGVFMLNGGFFRLPHDIPKPFWRYPVSYMAFHTYANQGFYKNDFTGLTFDSNVPGAAPITGDFILRDTYQVMGHSKWVDLAILLGMALLYRLLFFGLIKLKEKMRPIIRAMLSTSSAPKVTSTLPEGKDQ